MNAILRKSVRSSAALAGTLALALSLAACGGGGSTDDAADKPAETQEETTEPSDAGGEDEADSASADEIGDAVEDEGDDVSDDSADDDSDDAVEGDDSAADDGNDSDESDDAKGGDLDAATQKEVEKQVFVMFDAFADNDAKAVCGMIMDPTTGKAATGAGLDACAEGIDQSGQMDSITKDQVKLLKKHSEVFEYTADGDDVTVSVPDTGQELTFTQGDDGKWYMKA